MRVVIVISANRDLRHSEIENYFVTEKPFWVIIVDQNIVRQNSIANFAMQSICFKNT